MHRRERLTTSSNPDTRHDYLVELRGEPVAGLHLTVRYVPDRLVTTPDAFAAYVASVPVDGTLEGLALAVLDDVNNELVPRWAEVTAERAAPVPHRVLVEDRQPNWDNPHLFSRMKRI